MTKRERTMNQIYDVSAKMFIEQGYEFVTVSDICRALHITKPTFYSYQLTKDDLLIHFFEKDLETSDPDWNLCPDQDWLAGIGRGVDMLIKRCVDTNIRLWGSYLRICVSAGRSPVNIGAEWRQKMVHLIEQAQKTRMIRNSASGEEILHCMLIYMMGVSYRLCMDEPLETVYQQVHAGVDTILDNPASKPYNSSAPMMSGEQTKAG